MRRLNFGSICLSLIALSCGAGSKEEGSGGGSGSGSGTGTGTGSGSGSGSSQGSDLPGGEIDVVGVGGSSSSSGGSSTSSCTPPTSDATLTGRVLSPNLEIPISGALVYLTKDSPEPVPDGVYCAECVTLDCGQPYVLTNPDGTFELPAVSGTGWKLAVQKGQFLRVTDMDVASGANTVSETQSSLPSQWNPGEGMWIPRIAVYETSPDAVYNVLAKFGMGQVSASGELSQGTEAFTLLDDADEGAFLDDLEQMNNHHLIFLPCASTKFWGNQDGVVPDARAQNVRDYVAAGGKIYATDHSNEYIDVPFPSYQTFYVQDRTDDDRDIQPGYDNTANVVDEDLLAWLTALKDTSLTSSTLGSLPQIPTELNYTGIDAVHEVLVENDAGEMTNVGHHTWVEGTCGSCSDTELVRPMAISGSYGCGRMMFSTFETSSSAHPGMSAQELTLLYMILEIGVCHAEPPPPPPPTVVK